VELLDQVAQPLRLVEGLSSLDGLEALDGYQSEILAVVRRLLTEPATDVLAVTQAIAHVNDALTRRLLELAERELGPPPAAYSWLALGSHGRGEQVLSSDQDSALAFADDAPDTAAGYFLELADHVVTALARAGLPLCDGGYMATSWSRPIGEYRAMFHEWVDRPVPEALLRAEVFLDVRPVHGRLAVDVLDRTLVVGGARGPFRVQMARAAVTFRPPLTLFGRLRTDDGRLDVKRAGTAAIVLLGRLYALAGGSSARTTVLRLAAAAEAGTLSRQGAAELTDAYRFLTALRLRTQVEQVLAGRPAGNLVRLDDLPQEQRNRLRATLRHVRDAQEATASRFATHTVT
jgi:CBS domain-containing protein